MITVDFKKAGLKPGQKVLDIGCGSGRHVAAAYQHPEVVAIGTDLSFKDLGDARERLLFHDRLGEHGHGAWGLNVADITALPFARHSFDLVICSEVMEHIHDERAAVAELFRVLKPGHPMVISVPRYVPEWICWKLSDEYHMVNQGHIRIYRKKRLVSLFESFGMQLIGLPLRPQPACALLVAEMPGGPHPGGFPSGQPLSPFSHLGHHAETETDPPPGSSVQSPVRQEPGALLH